MIATPKGITREEALRRFVRLELCRDIDAASEDAGLIPGANEGLADYLAESEAAGRAHRIEIQEDGTRKGTIWLEIFGERCHVAAMSVRPGGPDAVIDVLPLVAETARKLGCNRISCQTARPGLIQKLSAAGFGLGDVFLVKHLT